MIRKSIWSAVVFVSMNASSMSYVFLEGKGLEISWQTDDRIGITTGVPQYGYTEQLCFWASAAEGISRNHRSVYATGYKLKDATRYLSYYPYRWIEDFNASAVSLSYTGQQQTASNSTAHLASYDYCAAAATPTNGTCSFSYHHLSAFLRITFTVPKDAAPTSTLTLQSSGSLASKAPSGVLSSMLCVEGTPPSPSDVLSSASPLYVLASTFRVEGSLPTEQALNLLAQGTDAELTTTATGPLSITLGALTPGTTYTAYMAMPQADLSSENIVIKLGDTPLATIKGFNAHPGCLYNIDLTTPIASVSVPEAVPALSSVPASTFRVEGTPLLTAAVTTPTAYLPDIPLDTDFILEVIPLRGDVNSDGIIDNTDADLIVHHYLGTLPDGAPFNPTAADINNDGAITISDANAIINMITK